ncbi:MAG: 5-formyltetrahydrofolate cyclo-ligase [Pseudomonadota bacterium]
MIDRTMLPPLAFFSDRKKILRERMKAERRAAARDRPDAAVHAAAQFLAAFEPVAGKVLALYAPIRDELDTAPLAEALSERSGALALPVVAGKKKPLVFRTFVPGDDLADGAYGAKTPSDAAEACVPEIILAPLLAFDRTGGRLGYGGGYYDRTLKALRSRGPVTAVGFAYGAQEVDAVPISPLDQALDWVVTEREAIRC